MVQGTVFQTKIAGFPAIAAAGAAGRPSLLFIHGAFATHEPFANWMAQLAQAGWGSIAVGRRNQNAPGPAGVSDVRIADYVADTMRVIDSLPEPPIVVGHSLGGLIAQKIAELGRCRAAVLLAPAPSGMLTAQPVALPALLPMFPKILLGQPIRPSCQTCETIALNCIPPAERTRIHDGLVHESGKVYREMIFGTFRVDAAKVRCPVLVVGGRQDRIVSPALMRSTAQRYGAEMVFFDDHGHWILEEPGWEKVAATVAAWLDKTIKPAVSETPRRTATSAA